MTAWLASVLPAPIAELADRSWPDGKSSIHHVRDADNRNWFVKCHHDDELYSNEVHAYRRWVPSLGNRAPTLHAHRDALRALVVSALPASGPQDWHDDEVRRDAGMLLRRLHDAEAFGAFDDIAAAKDAELERWVRRGHECLTAAEVETGRGCVRELRWLPRPERVPCHHDYTPRNWVIDNGRVQVIDFEETYPDAWMSDIVRMTVGFWKDEPHLTEAVLEGYGRQLSPDDKAMSLCLFAVAAIRYIVLGTELGNHRLVARIRSTLSELRPGRIDLS